MAQSDLIKDIAKFGLENDQVNLLKSLAELIEYFKQHKKVNFAIQLQSLLKDALRYQDAPGLVPVGSPKHLLRESDKDYDEFIIEKLTSDYNFDNLVCSETVRDELTLFVEEHRSIKLLNHYDLPVSNKVIFHGPSGCGKTLAAYVLAGELNKMMIVVNLGAIVSSRLGETSKNLAKIFRRAASEECIIFIDEFDSLGKVRDYSQDHGEMKRVVNTILQLFDYLPQDSLVIAATNQIDMIDEALLRRFDLQVKMDPPDEAHIRKIIQKTLMTDRFRLDNQRKLSTIIRLCNGLSYYTIQRTLITAIKRSLFKAKDKKGKPNISTDIWKDLVIKEKKAIQKA
ncbi:AAA family ATPase [Flavihumibacter sp.]|uniref:AAA family ATPase n=1 Tax=Flavihumibacter sp. TaxID=1913981 RepID=UPI002FC65878